MMMKKPLVGIVMGSESDREVMMESVRALDELGVPCEVIVSSAHRMPARTRSYARTARKRGLQVIIAGAGSAAHLAGAIASETTLPVIGVPLGSSPLKGLDALFSTVQMPAGVPVATMAVGKAGAKNAGLLAGEIIALGDKRVSARLDAYRRKWRPRSSR